MLTTHRNKILWKCPFRPTQTKVKREPCRMSTKSWLFESHQVNWRVALRAWEREDWERAVCACVYVCLRGSQKEWRRKKFDRQLIFSHESPITNLCSSSRIRVVSPSFGKLNTPYYFCMPLSFHQYSNKPDYLQWSIVEVTNTPTSLLQEVWLHSSLQTSPWAC